MKAAIFRFFFYFST
ncbi:pheST operon leader peptide PheM [Enterobacter asburiae]|nr:pheST operon leader peptide PheM [Enterobacter asburiae]MCB4612619.1 pheST operon leader peptide PheM [Enterobacter asburiae]MDO2452832.1 pheST operon leader peptide PheM [Enterobacter asburiae]